MNWWMWNLELWLPDLTVPSGESKSIWMEASHVWRNWKKRYFHTLRKMRTNVKTAGARSLVEVIWLIPSKKQTARYFRAVCHWIKERYEAGNTVIFCSISFFVSFCLYFKESCSCTGVHQLVILIKSGCDSLCRRKSGRIPEFSSAISGKLYNS